MSEKEVLVEAKERAPQMKAMTIEMEERGMLRLPPALRSKYRLKKGDDIPLLDLEGYVLLSIFNFQFPISKYVV